MNHKEKRIQNRTPHELCVLKLRSWKQYFRSQKFCKKLLNPLLPSGVEVLRTLKHITSELEFCEQKAVDNQC